MKTQTIVLPLIALLGSSSTCFGQLDRASLSGTVSDPSSGVIPQAKVTVTHVNTGITFSTDTNQSGVYSFSGLTIGEHTVAAEITGFNKAVLAGVILRAGASVRVDLTLTPGVVNEQVQVTATAPLLEERSSAYGVNVQTKTLDQLPLQVSGGKRSPYSFLLTVPGNTGTGGTSSIMGAVGAYSMVVVDGVTAEYNPRVMGAMYRPVSVESLGEFKVVNSVAAEYGMTGGAFVTFVTKSGANSYHGDAYEFFRNEALDARTFFALQVAPNKQNEFGFALGGPVVIPSVYNGHNRTFFFFNFTQFVRHSAAAGTVLTVPTDAMRGGDFSALMGRVIGSDALGGTVAAGQIFDPSSTRSDGKGGSVRTAFPGNIIPTSRFSPVSAKLGSYWPVATIPTLLANNFVGGSPLQINKEDNFIIRIDHALAKGKLYGNYKLGRGTADNPDVLPPIFAGNSSRQRGQSWRMAYTRPLSAHVISDSNFGVDRVGGPGSRQNPVQLEGATLIGLKGTNFPCTPIVTISGSYPQISTHDCTQGEHDTNWKYNQSVGVLVGKHTLKFGGNYYRWNANFRTTKGANGRFEFRDLETNQPGFAGNTGFGYASFLLGEVDASLIEGASTRGLRIWALGAFAQDEYRISPKLTLSYGLRYDYQPQVYQPHDDASEFDPSIPNPQAGGLLGALSFLGNGPGRNGRRTFSDTYNLGFGPRFGFAYTLTSRIVIRGSYGLFLAPTSEFSGEFLNRQGFLPNYSLASTNGGVTSAFNWTDGFPLYQGPNPKPIIDPSVVNGSGASFIGRHNAHPAQAQMINFSVQYQLPGNVLIEAAYMGNLTHHIEAATLESVNQLDYGRYRQLGSLLTADINSPAAVAAGLKPPFPGFRGSVAQALRPYPQYQGINGITSTIGNSTYHAGQWKLQKHYSNGLSFLFGYTFSKRLSDVNVSAGLGSPGVQDAYNRRAEKAVTTSDYPHAFVGSYTYELPFGHGKPFLHGQDIFSKHVAGGWTVSGIHTYRSGTAIGVSTNQRLPASGDLLATIFTNPPQRPDRVLGVNALTGLSCAGFDPATNRYLNQTAFAFPAPLYFGNAARVLADVRGCGFADEAISLMKYFPLTENRVNLRFGVDFFNIFNRKHFGNPAATFGNSNFGTITSAGPSRNMQLQMKVTW